MNEQFVTKVTPTVTNDTHANTDKQHKDLTQSVKGRCRHMCLFICNRKMLGLQSANDFLNIIAFSAITILYTM